MRRMKKDKKNQNYEKIKNEKKHFLKHIMFKKNNENKKKKQKVQKCVGRQAKCTVKQPPPYTTTGNNVHNHANNARKSWRSEVPIILPGWGHHTGGSRSIPTVHPC